MSGKGRSEPSHHKCKWSRVGGRVVVVVVVVVKMVIL